MGKRSGSAATARMKVRSHGGRIRVVSHVRRLPVERECLFLQSLVFCVETLDVGHFLQRARFGRG